jgi:hypothetical protein
MPHLAPRASALRRAVPIASVRVMLASFVPQLAMAQASPFLTGATALQTNARVAREYLVALPVELMADRRIALIRDFSQELSDRYQFAVDVAIHSPREFPGSDPRNFHAHLLATTREVTADGLGMKTALELNDASRYEFGLGPAINELTFVRQRWADVANGALRDARIEAHIDHRSLAAQGIDREPLPHIPRAAFEMERHGYRSDLAERLRHDYRQRIAAREAARDLRTTAPREPALHGASPAPAASPPQAAPASTQPRTLEEVRRQARENWLRMKQAQAGTAAGARHERSPDDDLAQ